MGKKGRATARLHEQPEGVWTVSVDASWGEGKNRQRREFSTQLEGKREHAIEAARELAKLGADVDDVAIED